MIFIFGDYELDSLKAELRRDGEAVPMERQAFDLLMLLADNAERVVAKDEIVEKVWDGRFISDSSISTAVKHVRRAVGDDGARQEVIRTIHGRGFRFAAPVTRQAPAMPAAEVPQVAPEAPGAADRPEGPSIAVLPFAVFGSGTITPAIGDALPAELIAALSRLRWLFVTARGSSFRFRDGATPPSVLRQALGVGYALTGTVEVMGEMLTIAADLTRTDSGAVIWSDRYTTAIGDIMEARSRIVGDVVAALEVHIP